MKIKKIAAVLVTAAVLIGMFEPGASISVSQAKTVTVTPQILSELQPGKTVKAKYKNTGTENNPTVYVYSFTTDSANADWSIRLKGDLQYYISDSQKVKIEDGMVSAAGNVPEVANELTGDYMEPFGEGKTTFYDSFSDTGLEKNKTYYIALSGVGYDEETNGKGVDFSITLEKQNYTQKAGKIKTNFKKMAIKKASLKKKGVGFIVVASATADYSFKLLSAPKGGKKKVTFFVGSTASISSYSDVFFKKKAPKGTYKIKVTSVANSHYKAASKTVTFKVK